MRLSKVNLFLHGFPDPGIHIYDTLSNDARWHEKADLIFCAIPAFRGSFTSRDPLDAWTKLAHALFQTNEAIFYN